MIHDGWIKVLLFALGLFTFAACTDAAPPEVLSRPAFEGRALDPSPDSEKEAHLDESPPMKPKRVIAFERGTTLGPSGANRSAIVLLGSKGDTTLAYLSYQYTHDAVHAFKARLVSMNLVNDKRSVLWTFESKPDLQDQGAYQKYVSETLYAPAHQKAWTLLLEKDDFRQQAFRILRGKEAESLCECSFALKRAKATGDEGYLTLTHEVTMSTKDRGSKTIGSVKDVEVSGIPYTGHAVYGVLHWPSSERIVVVIEGWARGFEGGPNNADFTFLGAHLNKGFRR